VAAGFYASEALQGAYKLMMGVTFTFALTMIIFAGGELFTGNVMIMSMGFLQKKIKLSQGLRLLLYCYLANVIGAAFMGVIIAQTGIFTEQTGEMLLSITEGKTSLTFSQGFFRGIMCNTLICLGTWCVLKLKSETAKLIVIFWAVLAFVVPGYEHSIANAGIFTMAVLTDTAAINFPGLFTNMLSSSLGNIVGGSIFVGLAYWYSGRELPAV
jgi:nitrite transporter NirC